MHTCWKCLKHVGNLSVVLLTLFLITACEQPGVVPKTPTLPTGSAGLTPPADTAPISTLTDLSQKWKIKPGDHLDTTPAVVDGVLYATIEDSCICAFDAQTGSTKWRVSPPGLHLSSPIVGNGMVYVAMYGDWQLNSETNDIKQTSYVYAFDADTGDGRWRFQGDRAEDEYASTPVVVDGIVYVGTGHADMTGITPPTGMVTALDGATGKVIWQVKTSGTEEGGVSVGNGEVFFDDGVDYDYQTDHLHAVDAKSGKEKWTKDVSPELGSLPLVHDNLLYFGGKGKLIVLDSQTGNEKWHVSLPADSFSSPVIEDGTLYFASNEERDFCIDNCPPTHYTDYISAVDAGTGSEKWKLKMDDGGGPFADLALYDGLLYYNTFRPNYLKSLDAATGTEKWQYEAEDSIFGAPAAEDGVVFLGIDNGQIIALVPPGSPDGALTPRPDRSATPVSGVPSTTTRAPVEIQEAPAKGFRAPDFTLGDVQENKPVTLSTLRGKPVFLNFWATWCPPCKEEMPRIERLYSKYQGQIEFLGISSSSGDDLQKVSAFINDGKFSWLFLHDPSDSVGSKYQAVSYPTSFFIDKAGVIRSIHIGEMEEADIEANLQAIK